MTNVAKVLSTTDDLLAGGEKGLMGSLRAGAAISKGLVVLGVAGTGYAIWRHPFSRRRGVIDIDPSALGLDGALLWLALRLCRLEPSMRDELRGDRVPVRLLDPREAAATTPQHVSGPVLAVFSPEGAIR